MPRAIFGLLLGGLLICAMPTLRAESVPVATEEDGGTNAETDTEMVDRHRERLAFSSEEQIRLAYRTFRDCFPGSELVVVSTGSQGEPYSALSLMAAGAHRHG
jgi:mRNA degradation ribonuclease J1/J2